MNGRKLPVHIALARGLNVGGKNRLPMKALIELFTEAGGVEVSTYIQSGNVLFTSSSAAAAKKIAGRVSELLEERHGLRIPFVVRSAKQLSRIANASPFPDTDPGSFHVAFLDRRPAAAKVARLDPDRSPPDRFEVIGSEIHVSCPNGVARSKLTTTWFDSALGTTSTGRNWRTLGQLIELCAGRAGEK